MYKQQKHQNIVYASALILILGNISSSAVGSEPPWLDLFLDIVAVNMIIFACGWLEKRALLVSLFFYVIDFNYSLLFNSLTSQTTIQSAQSASFGLYLNILGFIFFIVPLLDSKDIIFKKGTVPNQKVLISITIGITILMQLIIRSFG